VNGFERSLRRAINPLSTGMTRTWCGSRLFRWAVRRNVSLLSEMPRTRRQRRSANRREESESG
jgi:hypothetical protein